MGGSDTFGPPDSPTFAAFDPPGQTFGGPWTDVQGISRDLEACCLWGPVLRSSMCSPILSVYMDTFGPPDNPAFAAFDPPGQTFGGPRTDVQGISRDLEACCLWGLVLCSSMCSPILVVLSIQI